MITTTEIKVQYLPTSSTNTFIFDIPYFEANDVNIIIIDSAGTRTILELDAGTNGFTIAEISGNANNGGLVTTTESYTSGDEVTIYREVPVTQEAEFLRGGDIPPDVLNSSFDRSTAAIQQIQEATQRHILCPITDPDGLNYELPTVELRKNKAIGFDDDGNAITLDLADAGSIAVDTTKGLDLTNNIISIVPDYSTVGFNVQGELEVQDDGINSTQIINNAITEEKIVNNAVTLGKLAKIVGPVVIGSTGTSPLNPGLIQIKDEDDMVSDDPVALATQSSIKAYIDIQIAAGDLNTTQSYESAEQVIPDQDIDLTLLHGLGSTPKWAQPVFRCTTSEYGYDIGDEILLSNEHGDGAHTHTFWVNSTSIGFRRVTNTTYIANRLTTSQIIINEENWRLVFKAWK